MGYDVVLRHKILRYNKTLLDARVLQEWSLPPIKAIPMEDGDSDFE